MEALQKKTDELIKNATDENFTMSPKLEKKQLVAFGIGSYLFLFLLLTGMFIGLLLTGQMTLTDFIISIVFTNLLLLVPMFFMLKFITKKIVFNEHEIIIKTLFSFKKIDKTEIAKAEAKERGSQKYVVLYSTLKKLAKITNSYCHYDLAIKSLSPKIEPAPDEIAS